jgi:bacterial/archaeal transporter family protein
MWVLYALLAAVSAAAAITLSKAGLKKVDPFLAFAIQAVLILSISWGAVLVQKKAAGLAEIDRRGWIFLIAAGVMTTLSSLFQFNALKSGDASVVSSLERISLVITILFAVLFLHEQLNWKVVTGAVLMIGGAILIGFSRTT